MEDVGELEAELTTVWNMVELWQSYINQRLVARQRELQQEFQNKLVMVNLGSEWRELSDDGKAKFVKIAEAQKADLAAAAAKM